VGFEVAAPAFVLHTRAYAESDRIVTFLTATNGKHTGIAKGAKNSRRRFGGTLEPFHLVRIVYQERPGSDLTFLVRCELLHAHRSFTTDLDRYAAGSYLLELTDKTVFGPEPGGAIFQLLHDALTALDAPLPIDPVLRAFELHLLAASGYAPALDLCRACGTPALPDSTVFLTVERGGLVCRQCVRPGERVRPVAGATATALARLAEAPIREAVTADPTILSEAAIVAGQLIDAVVPSRLRSREFLQRTRVDSSGPVR
jgi:DNA repair protein RecO (recombination protein O)